MITATLPCHGPVRAEESIACPHGPLLRQLACAATVWSLLAFGALPDFTPTAIAAPPCVQFDANSMVGCRDITPPEFASANPDERLVEAKFQISSLIGDRSDDQLIEYLYRIESTEQSLRVVDYLPKTTLATSVAGNLDVETKLEKSSSIGITAGGDYNHLLRGDATAANSSKRNSSVHYELLPRLDLLAASGTTARGTGVYFKLKPSDRMSLEGARDFLLVLRVPGTWRGDYVRVTCQAKRPNAGLVRSLSGEVTCGSANFVVAPYDQEDKSAKLAALELVQAERRLLELATAYQAEIERRKYPTLGHEIGAVLALTHPKIPRRWLSRAYQHPARAQAQPFEKHLPEPVRRAAEEFRTAKRTLHELCGSDGSMSGAADLLPEGNNQRVQRI